MFYYEHHIGDYRKDTSYLTLLEHGIYRQLLDTYYADEAPLCLDDAKLMRLHNIRNADEVQAYKNVIQDFFLRTKDGYVHTRCEKLLAEYRSKSATASAAANKRWEKERLKKEINANAMQMHSECNADGMLTINHKPITNNQEPLTINREPVLETTPTTTPLQEAVASAPKKERRVDEAKRAANTDTWEAYASAYFRRYGTEPVRNAKTNSLISQFVDRIGRFESPLVAAFYVGHNNGFYVRSMHSAGYMLQDAEKLRTEWATNTRMTQTKAMQADKTQTNYDAFAPLLAEALAREEAERKENERT